MSSNSDLPGFKNSIPSAGETIRMADGSVGEITSVVSGVDLTNPLPHADWEVFFIGGAEVLARRIGSLPN